jgi:hypothetical protein
MLTASIIAGVPRDVGLRLLERTPIPIGDPTR